jgi:deoxyribodipyrimidine photolyase-related protein
MAAKCKMAIGIWILGDQLWTGQAALSSCETAKKQTPVILIESRKYVRQRPYHRQKSVLIWSAMRNFVEELHSARWPITYEIAIDLSCILIVVRIQSDEDLIAAITSA